MDELMPAIRVSLCDALPAVRGGAEEAPASPLLTALPSFPPLQVRDAAARAFSTLQAALGADAIAAVVPGLLASVEDPDQSEAAVGSCLPSPCSLGPPPSPPPHRMQATRPSRRRSRACATSSRCARAPASSRCCCRASLRRRSRSAAPPRSQLSQLSPAPSSTASTTCCCRASSRCARGPSSSHLHLSSFPFLPFLPSPHHRHSRASCLCRRHPRSTRAPQSRPRPGRTARPSMRPTQVRPPPHLPANAPLCPPLLSPPPCSRGSARGRRPRPCAAGLLPRGHHGPPRDPDGGPPRGCTRLGRR